MGEYLKYAIGEIVLVVIGILIALQINNWNEENSKKLQLNNYLTALKEELKGNLHRLDQVNNRTKQDIQKALGIIKKMNNDSANLYDSNDLYNIDLYVGPTSKIELYSAVYKDLLYAGVLENLKDTRLKKRIFQIERILENYDEACENVKKIWDVYLLPYYHKHKNVAGLWDSIDSISMPKVSFSNDIKAFVYNRDYSNLLSSRARQSANLKTTAVHTKEVFEDLIHEINFYFQND